MSSIYIHIPFCAKRCFYCDFHSGTNTTLIENYIDALEREFEERISEMQGSLPRTIYIGGGTPSQLNPKQLSRLFDILQRHVDLSAAYEITVEVNPDDITPEYAANIASLPINRVSMGVQSFSDRLLQTIGRRHNSQTAITAYETLRNSGINNISIDLIFSLPTQTMQEWEATITQALLLCPQHISAYDLSYEPGSLLTQKLKQGAIEPCSDELSLQMYDILIDKLANAGYEHYEISNFAKQGYRSQHNSGYWNGTPYLGLGASAHSFDGKVRRANIANTALYINNVLSQGKAYDEEYITPQQSYNETIFTRLRTVEGIDLKSIELRYGKKNLQHLLREAASYIKGGYLKEEGGQLLLTRKGIAISDTICCDLFL